MYAHELRSALSGFATTLRSWRHDKRGVAALEFAMIVPVMFTLFVGTIEMSQAITVDRRVTQIANATADLVARESSVTTAQVNNIFAIAKVLMAPFDTTKLRITIVSVGAKSTSNAVTKVCWSQAFQGGTATYTAGQAYALPSSAIIDAGGSVVVSEVQYNYDPLIFHYFITSTTKLTDKFYLKPRVSSMIQYNGGAICTVS